MALISKSLTKKITFVFIKAGAMVRITKELVFLFFESLYKGHIRSFLKLVLVSLYRSIFQFWTLVSRGENHIGDVSGQNSIKELKNRTKSLSGILRKNFNNTDTSFSVLIPVYKPNPKFFKQALLSVCEQTADNFEVLIGFDGPQPGEVVQVAGDIKNEFNTANGSKIRIFNLDRNVTGGGISNTTNELAKNAKNEYLVLMDHDDWIRPDMLLRYEQTLLLCEDRKNTEIGRAHV